MLKRIDRCFKPEFDLEWIRYKEMEYDVGVDNFNSCDWSGSIRYFSDHLRKYPNDYNALIWRSKAYSFVGQKQNALRDTEHAIWVSSGVNREIAVARNIRASGDIEAYGCQAKRTVKKYPDDWKALMELGTFFTDVENHQKATRCYRKSLSIAIKYNETSDSDICWLNYFVGNSLLKKKDVDTAKSFYEAAIDSCSTHTLSYIQLCRCNISQSNISAAYKHFMKAKMLNQSLAFETFQTKSFKEYVSRERPRAAPVSRAAAGIQGGGAVGGATVGLVKGNDNSNDYCDNKLQRAGKPDYGIFPERLRNVFDSSEEAGIQGGGAQGGDTGRLVEGNDNSNDYCDNKLLRAAIDLSSFRVHKTTSPRERQVFIKMFPAEDSRRCLEPISHQNCCLVGLNQAGTKSFNEDVSRERPRYAVVKYSAAGIQGGGAEGELGEVLISADEIWNDDGCNVMLVMDLTSYQVPINTFILRKQDFIEMLIRLTAEDSLRHRIYFFGGLNLAGKKCENEYVSRERSRFAIDSKSAAGIQGGGADGELGEDLISANNLCIDKRFRLGLVQNVLPAYQAAYGRGLPTTECAPAEYYYPGFSSYTLISSETEKCTMSLGEFAAMTTGVPPIQRSEPSPLPTSFLQRDIDTQAPLETYSLANRLDREEFVSARSGIGLNIVEGNGLNIDELNSRFCFEEATSGPNYCWAGLNQTGIYTQPFTIPCLPP